MTIFGLKGHSPALEELARDPLLERYAPGCTASLRQATIEQIVTRKIKEMLAGTYLSPTDKVELLERADSILSRWTVTSKPPKNIQELERCTLAVRSRKPLYLVGNEEKIRQLRENVQAHQKPLLKKWTETYHFSPELFFEFPEFVDFVFASRLHRAWKYHGEPVTMIRGEPSILIDGVRRPWSEIKDKFSAEKGKIYSIENGVKTRWEYLYQGLTKYDSTTWTEPKPIKVLSEKPGHYSLVVISSHVPPKDQNFADRVLKGARHAWFRVITPEGEVYSFGKGFNPADASVFQPFAGLRSVVDSPDTFEYYAEHRYETTVPVTPEQGQNILRIVKEHAKGDLIFSTLDGNCTNFIKEVLDAAGIRDVHLEEHVSGIAFKLFIPKFLRKFLSSTWNSITSCVMPEWMRNAIIQLKNFIVSMMFMPLLSLLGAWRVSRADSPASVPTPAAPVDVEQPADRIELIRTSILELANQEVEWVRKKAGPIYTSVWDALNPNRLTFTMPNRLAKWQRQQGERTRFY